MKRAEGGWIVEPGDPLPIKPEVQQKIAEILAQGVVRLIRDGKLTAKDGKIDWSRLPQVPVRKKPRKGQGDFRITELFVPDQPPEAEAAPAVSVPLAPSTVPERCTAALPAVERPQEPPSKLTLMRPGRNAMTCDACGAAVRLLHADAVGWLGTCSAPACATLHRGSLRGR